MSFPDPPLCDFCHVKGYSWWYRVQPFILAASGIMPIYVDDGEWAACADCMLDVENHDDAAITERLVANVARYEFPDVLDPEGTRTWSRRLLTAFRANLIEGPMSEQPTQETPDPHQL